MNCEHSKVEILLLKLCIRGQNVIHHIIHAASSWMTSRQTSRCTSGFASQSSHKLKVHIRPPWELWEISRKESGKLLPCPPKHYFSNWPRSVLAAQKRDPTASKADEGARYHKVVPFTNVWPWNNCQRNRFIRSQTLILLQTLLKVIMITCSDVELIKWFLSSYFLV